MSKHESAGTTIGRIRAMLHAEGQHHALACQEKLARLMETAGTQTRACETLLGEFLGHPHRSDDQKRALGAYLDAAQRELRDVEQQAAQATAVLMEFRIRQRTVEMVLHEFGAEEERALIDDRIVGGLLNGNRVLALPRRTE